MLILSRSTCVAIVLFCTSFLHVARGAQMESSDILRARWNLEAQTLAVEQFPSLERQAQAGDLHAIYLLYYQFGRPQSGFSQRPAAGQVASWLRPHAERNNALALRSLSFCYRIGVCGVEKNTTLSLDLLRKSAELGFAYAQYLLGTEYVQGTLVSKDAAASNRWIQSALALGSTDAMRHIAWHHLYGTEKNPEKAIELYLKAGGLGDGEAYGALGELYRDGTGVVKNDVTAVSWFRKGADLGATNAMLNLGWMYFEGRGVEKSTSMARQWYERSATTGNIEAARLLGWCYLNGTCTEQNDAKAFTLFKTAAEAGNKSAANTLGWLYERGRGTTVDKDKAQHWWELAAEGGDSSAMFNLGIFYRDGLGSLQDDEEALKWFKKASDLGNLDGKNALAKFHEDGRVGPTSSDKVAIDLYRQTAAKGSAYGMYRLGVMLDQGRGGASPRREEADKWLDQAAKRGQQRNVDDYRKQTRLESFRLALVQAHQKIAIVLPLAKSSEADTELKGASTPDQLLERVAATKSFKELCSSGLASRNVCEGTSLANLVKRYSQENLIEYSQLKGSYSILVTDVIQALNTSGKAKMIPVLQEDKAVLSLNISNGKIKTALNSPEFREPWLASMGQSLGMMAFSMAGGNEFDASAPGALLGKELGDVLIALLQKYGANARSCMDLAGAAAPHRLRDLELTKATPPYTAADECVDRFLDRYSADIFHDLLQSLLPLADAVMQVYGTQLFPERDREEINSILQRVKGASLRNAVSYIRSAKSAEFSFSGLRRELQWMDKGRLEEILRLMETINVYLYRTPQYARMGVFVFAGADNFRFGKDVGISDVDQYLQSLNRTAATMQSKEVTARITLRRQSISGWLGQKQQAWLVDDITFPSLAGGQ